MYTSNNTVAATALENWSDRIMAGEWVLLVAVEELLGTFGKARISVGGSCAVLSGFRAFGCPLWYRELHTVSCLGLLGLEFYLRERKFLPLRISN